MTWDVNVLNRTLLTIRGNSTIISRSSYCSLNKANIMDSFYSKTVIPKVRPTCDNVHQKLAGSSKGLFITRQNDQKEYEHLLCGVCEMSCKLDAGSSNLYSFNGPNVHSTSIYLGKHC